MAKPILIPVERRLQNVAKAYLSANAHCMDERKVLIYNWLVSINSNATYDEVRSVTGAVYGDEYLASSSCDGCGERCHVVQVGAPTDYESATACLCKNCVREAWLLIKDIE